MTADDIVDPRALDVAGLVPHAGKMCLLERVTECSGDTIRCEAGSHRAPDNPLRVAGRLPAVVAIEYAAQAMAVHGVLAARTDPRSRGAQTRPGFLVGVRDLRLGVERLDELPAPLAIEAVRIAAGEAGLVYRFEIHAGSICVASGRASVMIAPSAPS